MLSFMIILLLINKRKYFKSNEWNAIKASYADNIKMVSALNQSIKISLKEYYFDVTLNCSSKILAEAKKNPVETVFRCFELVPDEKLMKYLNSLEREYRIMLKEHNYIKKRMSFVKKIKKSIPFWVRIFSNNINHYLGLDIIDSIKYPKYRFSCYCNASGHYQTVTVIMDFKMIRMFKQKLQRS